MFVCQVQEFSANVYFYVLAIWWVQPCQCSFSFIFLSGVCAVAVHSEGQVSFVTCILQATVIAGYRNQPPTDLYNMYTYLKTRTFLTCQNKLQLKIL